MKTAPTVKKTAKKPVLRAAVTGNVDDHDYFSILAAVQRRFRMRVDGQPVFTTDADPEALWETYLDSFPRKDRAFHTCTACRRFIQAYGGLVTIGEDGSAKPAVFAKNFDPLSPEEDAFNAVGHMVARSNVTGVFLTKERVWGQPVTGCWRHVALTVPDHLVYTGKVLTPGQAMAERREDFKNVSRALSEYPAALVNQALGLLKSDALYRAEKVLGPCQFLADLHAAVNGNSVVRRANIVWRAVATAPAGFCHPRSSMVGTLLDDLAAGMSFDAAAARFKAKMHPLQYQRPQAAPAAGNIAAAEKLVEKLGIARSLERRFARVEEIEAVWRPAREAAEERGGVFGHLKAKGESATDLGVLPAQNTTWVRFASKFLPEAVSIEAFAPARGNYTAILTAEHADAPPIHQWDSETRRNPFSTYTYAVLTPANQWNLASPSWVRVTAVADSPHQWYGDHPHHGKGAVVILEGAKDTRTGQGNALFPETLKSELREVRSTIESYSRSAKIGGREEASACGLAVGPGLRLRVTDRSGVRSEFVVDRYE